MGPLGTRALTLPCILGALLWLGQAGSAGSLDGTRRQAPVDRGPALKFSGQTDIRYGDGGADITPFSFNVQGASGGVSSFEVLDLHLFLASRLGSRSRLFIKLLGTTDDGNHLSIDSLVFSTKLGAGWPILELGRILDPFGRFPQRFLPADNPLIGEPLIYTYQTSLATSEVPASPDDLVSQRGKGLSPQFAGYTHPAVGQSLISSGWFLNGVEFVGSRRKLRYAAALTNEPAGGSRPLAVSDNKAVTLHVGYKPDLPLGIGVSYSHGDYLDHGIFEVPAFGGVRVGQFPEDDLGLDIDYFIGHFGFFGELVHKKWPSPTIPEGLYSNGYFLEPRFKIAPGLVLAARFEQLFFSNIATTAGPTPWEFDVQRLELGAGYSIERDVRLKTSYEWNLTRGASPRDPDDNLFQIQLVTVF